MTVMLVLLAGCRAPFPHAAAPDRTGHQPAPAPAPNDAQHLKDGSYDWHGLLIAPFGSVLKDIPVALHEVLLFRDEARGSAALDDAECFASDAPAPRFVGRVPDEYLLCFKQDRLARVQASVHLTAAEAPEVFAAACAGWLENARASTGAEAQSAPGAIGVACEGREGAIRFSAHLGEDAGRADMPQTEEQPAPQTEEQPAQAAQTVLSIRLDGSP